MPGEVYAEVPFVEEMLATLAGGETFRRNMTGPELKTLMDKVVENLLLNPQPGQVPVKLRELPSTAVTIGKDNSKKFDVATVAATAHVLNSPIGAIGDLKASMMFYNKAGSNWALAIAKPGVVISAGQAAVGAAMEKQINAKIESPNVMLGNVMRDILATREMKPTGMSLHLEDDHLNFILAAVKMA